MVSAGDFKNGLTIEIEEIFSKFWNSSTLNLVKVQRS